MFNIIYNRGREPRDFNKSYVLAFCCLTALTFISHLLPVKIRLDVFYVCCVLLVVGQSLKKIIIYSLIACCLILVAHLGINPRLRLSWVAFVNASISITAALITSYVANKILRKNEVLEHNVAEGARNLAEVNNTLKKSQSHLRSIFKTTDIAFLLLDSDLQILTYNAIADEWSEHLFGAKLREGAYFVDLLLQERKKSVSDMMHAALTGTPIAYETFYPALNGTEEWYHISINPVKDLHDKITGLCCSANYITPAKLAEIEHSRITNDLVQKNKDLGQFAYIVSRNLITPMANITGLCDTLQQDSLPLDERKQTEDFLFRSVKKMDEVVSELNHILKDRRKIEKKKEMIFFSELLKDVLTGFSRVIEQQDILILTDFSAANEFFTIKSYLYSVFYNLVSNSIKYRNLGRSLIIEIKTWRKAGKVMISCKDNGRGSDLAARGNEVFGLYKRFHPDVEGTGMGLFMVKNQVRALGGDIEVQSQPGVGTTFLIWLPY
jgi:signal transduction histidine kinase